MRLYDHPDSYNCYKVRLALAHAGKAYERVHVSNFRTEEGGRGPLERAPRMRAPVLELSDGHTLAEANVIAWHVLEGTPFVPADAWLRARAMQWLFFEQWRLMTSVGLLRYWYQGGKGEEKASKIDYVMGMARDAIVTIDRALARHDWLVGEAATAADVVVFPLLYLADEAGVDVAEYAGVGRWLARMAALPGHVELQA